MKYIKYLALSLAAAAVLCACVQETSDPLSSTISTDKSELVLADTGNPSGTVAVTASGDWIAVGSDDDWFDFTPRNGSGNGTITVTATANVDDSQWHEIAGPRSATITILGEEKSVKVTVKQAGEPGLDASRNYTKVKEQGDLEAGKGYLIVANTGEKLLAAKAFDPGSRGESYYSYIYADEVEDNGGTIVRKNASNGYTLVAKDGGYAVQMPNGRYLFQAAAYNNFYSTDDLAKADVWNVTIQGDGTAKIENQTVAGKYFQYSIGYSSYGSYSSAQDNAVLPILYKDSAAPSDEILLVQDTKVAGAATSVSIPVTSNKTWKVRNHDSWIKSFTPSGSGNGAIEVTFYANTSYDQTRTATFTIIGETTNFEVTLTQDVLKKAAATIAGIVSQIPTTATGSSTAADYEAELTGAVVSYVNGNNAYLEDESGAILLYKSGHGLNPGDVVSGKLTGKGYYYRGLPEITEIGTEFTKTTGGTIPQTEMTIANLLSNFSANLSRRILLKDVTITDGIADGDRQGKVSQSGSEIAVYAQLNNRGLTLEQNAQGDFICFPTYNNTTPQLSFWSNDLFTAQVKETVVMLYNCDEVGTWGGMAGVDTGDKTEGTGCLWWMNGAGYINQNNFASPVDASAISIEKGIFAFDLYVENVADFKVTAGDGEFEIGSTHNNDQQELNWKLKSLDGKLKAGWNNIELKLSEANKSADAINMAQIQRIRFYHVGFEMNNNIQLKVDNVRLIQR